MKRPTLSAVRGFGVVLGGPLVLDAAVAVAAARTARALRHRRRPSPAATVVLALAAVHLARVRPWMHRWGTTPAERRPDENTHAVTIDAPPEAVWPWLVQIGADRGGFYSYDVLENLAGCGLDSADRIHPEWQHRAVGDPVMLHPEVGLPVTVAEPGRALGIENWGTFELRPTGDGGTRLVVRSPVPHGTEALYVGALLDIPHFVMQRRMLLGLKARAEAAGRP